MVELLERLRRDDFGLTIVVTAKPTAVAEPLLAHLGLRAAFDAVYGAPMGPDVEEKRVSLARALATTRTDPEQAVMIGDKRKYPIVLIVPDWDQLEKWAAEQNIVWTSRAELLKMPTIQAKMEKEVKGELTGLGSYETPKKVGLLEHDFSIERGELTPKLSVKRRVVEKTNADVIEGLYAE
jgi:hypothetical protein